MHRKAIYLALLAALGLLAVPLAAQAQVTNLAPNPSMEEDEVVLDDPDWTAWCTWNDAAGAGSNAKFDDTEAVDGLRSLRVDAKGTENWHFVVALISMPAKLNTKYTASFWAKAQDARPLGVQWKAADNSVSWGYTDFQLTKDWAEYHFTVASQSTDIKMEFFCAAPSTPFWLDFVYVYEGDYVAGIMPSGAGPRGKAIKPDPANGAVVDLTYLTLKWMAGDFAASHAVYFNENFADVNDGVVAAITATKASLSVGSAEPYPAGLTPGATYYWRVDEVNEADPNSPWKGDVWSFRVRPLTAWNPSPADGLLYVRVDQDLTWEYGLGNIFHTVYFGDNYDAVAAGTASSRPTVPATYDPGVMQVGKTYYWRVDEFANYTTQKGSVWSLTTVPEIAVTDPDLLGWWKLDEGMGTTAVDWSGHGHHGAISGDAKWTHGVQGGALQLDGVDDYVEVPDVGISGAAARTISGWAKASNTSIASWTDVFGFSGPSGNGGHFDIERRDYSSYALHIYGWERDLIPVDLEWHHFAATYDGTNAVRYADGVSIGSEAVTLNTTATFHMGKRVDNANFFPGVVDDVRLYKKVLSEAEIQAVMRGDASLAWNPSPAPDAVVDVRDADSLTWSAGDGAGSHDVYFGAGRSDVTDANHSSAAYKGNQAGTSFSLAGLVAIGAGDCFWRIDEVEAGGTVHKGNVWQFNVLAYLLIDDFESYTNNSPDRVFQTWIDGAGFSPDEFFPKGGDGNGSGALVGYDPEAGDIMEPRIVNSGGQSMPLLYDNSAAPKYAETERTFSPAQNWTVAGVTTLVVHFRGAAGNTGQLYVKINGKKVPYNGPAADIAGAQWVAWPIDLASAGVSLTSVKTLAIGIDGGGTGTVYIDDIRLTKP